MTTSKIFALAATAATLLFATGAVAQFYSLPNASFRWNWGETDLERRFGHPDIEMTGREAFFDCDFTVRFRPSTNSTPSYIRAVRDSLNARLDFIYAVSETMYYMDQNREIDWATLDCEKYEAPPTSPEQSAERQTEAREKMLRELERRRARARDDD
jgi:hypothetical protein